MQVVVEPDQCSLPVASDGWAYDGTFCTVALQ